MHSTVKAVPSRPGDARVRRFLLAPVVLALFALAATGCSKQNAFAPEMFAPTRSAVAGGTSALADATPLHLEGVLDSGALWAIDRPANWNGDLVLYAHGYMNPLSPISLPSFGPLRDSLLARGYAVAASSYSKNGYASTEGVRETHELKGLFVEQAGKPAHTFIVGRSLGGLIGMLLAQRYTTQYDGALLVAGVIGGSDEEVQYIGDIRVLFDAVYGSNVLGGSLYHPVPVTDAELNQKVVGPVLAAIQANPNGVGIIQMLLRKKLPGATPQEWVGSLIKALVFAAEGGNDFYVRTHELSNFDNKDYHYTSPYLPSSVIDYVNANVARYELEPGAAQYLRHWGEPEGPIAFPVVTMHNLGDPVVPIWHEANFAAVAGGPNLRQYSYPGLNHDEFSTVQIMERFVELTTWVGSNNLVAAGGNGRLSD